MADSDRETTLANLAARHAAGQLTDAEYQRARTTVVGIPLDGGPGSLGRRFGATFLGSPADQTLPHVVADPPVRPRPSVAERRKSRRWPLIAAAVAVAIAVGLSVFVIVQSPSDAGAPGRGSSGAGPSNQPTATAQQGLDSRVRADSAAVDGLLERWVPQLFAKRIGAAATTNADSILRDVETLTRTYPRGVLLESGQFSSFERPGYYVMVMPLPFGTPGEALNWCAAQRLDRERCYAKRLSRTVGPAGSAAYPR